MKGPYRGWMLSGNLGAEQRFMCKSVSGRCVSSLLGEAGARRPKEARIFRNPHRISYPKHQKFKAQQPRSSKPRASPPGDRKHPKPEKAPNPVVPIVPIVSLVVSRFGKLWFGCYSPKGLTGDSVEVMGSRSP